MNSGANFSQGFLQGFGLTENILDGVEERKHRGVLRKREEEQYQYHKKRQGVIDSRQDMMYKQSQEDRTRGIERQSAQDQRALELHTINIRSAADAVRLRQMNMEKLRQQMDEHERTEPMRQERERIDQEMARLGLDSAKHNERLEKRKMMAIESATEVETASQLYSQAQQALQSGDKATYSVLKEQAQESMKKLRELNGWDDEDYEHIMEHGGSQIQKAIQDTIESIQKPDGLVSIQDKQKLAKMVFSTTMKQSGRMENGLKVSDIQYDPQDGMFYPILENKDGKRVPPTELMSDHPGDDNIKAMSLEEVMGAAQTFIGQANLAREINMLDSMAARAGTKSQSAEDPRITVAKINQQTELQGIDKRHNAKLAEMGAGGGNSSRRGNGINSATGGNSAVINALDESEHGIANLFLSDGVPESELASTLRGFRQWRNNNKADFYDDLDAYDAYQSTQEIEAVNNDAISHLMQNEVIQAAGLSKAQVTSIHNGALKASGNDLGEYNNYVKSEIDRIGQQKARKEGRQKQQQARKSERLERASGQSQKRAAELEKEYPQFTRKEAEHVAREELAGYDDALERMLRKKKGDEIVTDRKGREASIRGRRDAERETKRLEREEKRRQMFEHNAAASGN